MEFNLKSKHELFADALTFDDVLLVPGYSNVLPREVDISTQFSRNIRINVISPGVVPTPAYEGLGLTGEQLQAFVDVQLAAIPMGRVGTGDDIAKAVCFLASDDSSFVNGVELFVDGGMTQI